MSDMCEVCRVADADVRDVVLGGLALGSMPLHAHSLHRACVAGLNRRGCESCCSVIVGPAGKLRCGRKSTRAEDGQ